MRRCYFICLLLAGITLALYWPSRHFDLIYFDDPVFVTDTPEINSGLNWHSLVFASTSLLAANWHPLTNLTFLLTHQFAAPNPGLEHLVNASLHASNAVLLFLLLIRLTGATGRSALAAALFAWHPLRVESVAWIAERKDVLSLTFFLLTLLAYAIYSEKLRNPNSPARRFFYLSLFLFALGLMSKPMLVSTPFVLLLLDIWPLQRLNLTPSPTKPGLTKTTIKHLVLEKWPFFALSLLFCGLTYLSQRHGAAVSFDRLNLSTRLANIVCSYLRYLGKTFWPQHLALIYPFPYNAHAYLALWPEWQLLSAIALLLLISVLCCHLLRHRPYLFVGWFWFLITLLPVIGLVQVGGQGMADRYTYLPSIGPILALVWLGTDLTKKSRQKFVLLPASILILAACLWCTRQQLAYWRDTVTLFTHTIDVTGENALGELILADGYDHAGFTDAALFHYRIVSILVPNDKESYQEIGRLMLDKQEWEIAADNFRMVLKLDPNETTAYLGLVRALLPLGHSAEVIDILKKALILTPDSPNLMNNLAWQLATTGDASLRDGKQAVQLAERACKLTHRQQTIMLGTLAAAYAEAGRFNDAVATGNEACENARKNGEDQLWQRNQKLLGFYQKQQPYHERERLVPNVK